MKRVRPKIKKRPRCIKCCKEIVTREGGTCPNCLELQYISLVDNMEQRVRVTQQALLLPGHQGELPFEDPKQLKLPFDACDWLKKDDPLGEKPPKPKIQRIKFEPKKIKRVRF